MTEVAVVGVADTLEGQVAKAFVVTNGVAQLDSDEARHQLEADIMRTVDEQLGAVARELKSCLSAPCPRPDQANCYAGWCKPFAKGVMQVT